MEKNYRITLDLQVKVNEKVKVKGKIDQKSCEHIQEYLDYLFANPGKHSKFHKVRFLWKDLFNNKYNDSEIKKRLKIANDDDNYLDIASNLPTEAENYFKKFFCNGYKSGSDEDDKLSREFWIFISQFGGYKVVKAEIEDMSEK